MKQAGSRGKFDILIYEKGTEPSTLLQLSLITHESSSYQVFHSFYEEIQSEFPISVTAKNLFLSLAESITQTKCNFVLCLWRNKYGRPLAMRGKRTKLKRVL
jgi:hypothetical protein